LIITDKGTQNATSAKAKAGIKQELDVAFYLRRAFKDHKQVFVFNDLKFSYKEETAQIDHLILYPYGFVLIESKSITGEVRVNEQEEWTRSYHGKWQGMPSPIKQVELQQRLFRDLLFEHRAEILGTILLKQESFGGRCWDNLCAVSSNAIIDRESMPKKISKQLVKSEFVVDKLNTLMKLKNKILNAIKTFEVRPSFSESDMTTICKFILSQDITDKPRPKAEAQLKRSLVTDTPVVKKAVVWKAPSDTAAPTIATAPPLRSLQLTCKKCGLGPKLTASYGKYGYYTICSNCSGNTSMKQSCPSCESKKTKISKKRDAYTLNCLDCQDAILLAI